MRRRRVLLVLPAAAGALALALILALDSGRGRGGTSPSGSAPFAGAPLGGNVRPRDFTLHDQYGQVLSLRGVRGQVTMLAFVSTRCGACVLLAQQIRGALDDLRRPVPVLLVSADPAADAPARVSRFLAQVSLAGRAHYLTGSLAALRPIWGAYRIGPPSADRAAFERAATVLLLDRGGRERVIFGLEQLTPEGLAHDVERLR